MSARNVRTALFLALWVAVVAAFVTACWSATTHTPYLAHPQPWVALTLGVLLVSADAYAKHLRRTK